MGQRDHAAAEMSVSLRAPDSGHEGTEPVCEEVWEHIASKLVVVGTHGGKKILLEIGRTNQNHSFLLINLNSTSCFLPFSPT